MSEDIPKKTKRKGTYLILFLGAVILVFGWAFANHKIGLWICWVSDGKYCSFNMPPFKPAPAWKTHVGSY
ncbi:MAG: hypothetical protein IPH06_10820 [Alphaproteobacteria bacterium]|nr:hypothetical protein [Alphaproteobacteria bacterium]QQS58474.1 MAG: hypothetical protein IPN28_06575 [Alphaproteobacteria bacterium]